MITVDEFKAHLESTGFWPREGKVVVAYSGGADSTCLLHILATAGFEVIAAHLHHGMRSEADREQSLCAAFAESLGVPFAAGKADVPALAEEHGVGLEEAGRIARYIFLRQTARTLNAVAVATGHTRTDHAETVLMHVLRGSGRRGLGGIEAASGDLLRPLLPYSRVETRTYCEGHNLWFHDDPANSDDQFLRSRLRNRVFPILQEMNPGVELAIARLADVTREEDTFLDGAAAAALEQLEVALNGPLCFLTHAQEIALDIPHMRHLPLALLRRGVRLCFETLGASLDYHQTEVVVNGLVQGEPGSLTSDRGSVVAEWDQTRFHLRRDRHVSQPNIELEIPGRLEADEWGWSLSVETEPYRGQESSRTFLEAFLALDAIQGPLRLRTLASGDRLQPLGFSGTRKVSDLMSEAKITQAARAVLPIIEDTAGPIWIPGVSFADRVKVTSASDVVLKLVFGPAAGR